MFGLEGVFGEEKKFVNRDAALVFLTGVTFVLELELIVGRVGLFLGLSLAGLVSRLVVMFGCSDSSDIPNGTGAEDPVNQDARPFDLSATFIAPSLSPVNVGMKLSTSCFGLFRSGLFEVVLVGDRKGNKEVNDRCWVLEGLAGECSCSGSKERDPSIGCRPPAPSFRPCSVYSPSLE